MKFIKVIFTALLCFFLSNECLSQLIADAGNDTAFCASNWEEAVIGGNPSAKDGTPPYQYAWSAEYKYAGHTYTASHMLVDTTVANPVFRDYFNDSAVFHLMVTDSKDSIAYDSVTVRFSDYIICLGECRHYISIGDSVNLGHCIQGGIPPYQFSWTPEESLSDPNSESPWAKPKTNTTYVLLMIDSIGCQAGFYCRVYIDHSGIQTEGSSVDHLQIYPNPAQDIIKITINHSEFLYSTLEIYNTEGKLVRRLLVNEPEVILEVNNLLHGLYICKLRVFDETIDFGKFVVK